MAGSFNKVILMGNLTRDPELKHTTGNHAVAKIGLAVNRRWRSAEGEQREETTFIDCEAWGKTAENLSRFFKKGRPILVEGRLKLDQWEDKETGKKQSKLRVVVEGFEFVDSKQDGGGDEGGPRRGGYSAPSAGGEGGGHPAPSGAPGEGGDDIPF